MASEQAFNPDAYLAKMAQSNPSPSFDPDEYLSKMKDAQSQALAQKYYDKAYEEGPAYTLGEHWADKSTGGFLPHITAATAEAVAPLYDLLTGSHVTESLPSYTQMRDEEIAAMQKHKDQNPIAGWTGDIGGTITSAALAGGALKGAGLIKELPAGSSLLANTINNARTGFVLGGLANPGDTAGEVSPLQLNDRLKNATIAGGASAVLTPVLEGAKYIGSRALGALTSTPHKAVEIYAERAPQVQDLSNTWGENVSEAADEAKGKILNGVRIVANDAYAPMDGALSSPEAPDFHGGKILNLLQKKSSEMNPHIPSQAAAKAQIQDMINMVANNMDQDGMISAKTFYGIKREFQTMGQGAYTTNGKDLIIVAEPAAKVAQASAAIAREDIHSLMPEIAHGDEIYSELHAIDNKMSTSLLAQSKSENMFASAGGGKNNANRVLLRQIGDLIEPKTGIDPVAEAEKIYAMKAFVDSNTRQQLLKPILYGGNLLSHETPSGSPGFLVDEALGQKGTNAVMRRLGVKNINRRPAQQQQQEENEPAF